MATRKKRPEGKDYGRRLYVTNRPYMDQMGDTTVFSQLQVMLFKHSEFEKPYVSDDYPDMQYRYPEPNPRPDPPGPVPPDPHPPRPNPIDPNPPVWIVFRCFFDGCFCPGKEKCGTLQCTQDITGAKSSAGSIRLQGTKTSRRMCITAGAGEKSTIRVRVSMVHFEYKGTRITLRKTGSHEFVVDECSPEECEQCNCGGTIGYTTQQMACSDSQNLTIVNQKPYCTYTWEVSSGGGSITSGGVYTAPATNANCSSNATISLKCEGSVIATLEIAINCDAGGGVAYWGDWTCGVEYDCHEVFDGSCTFPPNNHRFVANCPVIYRASFGCDGTFIARYGTEGTCGTSYSTTTCKPEDYCDDFATTYCDGNTSCAAITPCASVDKRTALQITNGCCPAVLL